jgi:hypothetical protein
MFITSAVEIRIRITAQEKLHPKVQSYSTVYFRSYALLLLYTANIVQFPTPLFLKQFVPLE